jgi:hypothetical protein
VRMEAGPPLFLRWFAGAGRRLPGGPRAWPEGISDAYWRTLSTDIKRVGARFRGAPGALRLGRCVALRAVKGRSRESVTWMD